MITSNATTQIKNRIKTNKITGHAYFKIHIWSCIGNNYESIYTDFQKTSKENRRLDSYGFINEREKIILKLLEWVVIKNIPLVDLNNELTRGILNTKPISGQTIRKYILILTKRWYSSWKSIGIDLTIVNEWSIGIVQHVEYMCCTLKLYNKSLKNMVTFISDNYSINEKNSNDYEILLLGSACHRFNLAVNLWLENEYNYNNITDDIHKPIVELRKF